MCSPTLEEFLLQVFPHFHGIRFSTPITGDSVLTMACELVKKMYDFWEPDKIGFESIYLAGCLWTSFPSPP